MSIAYVLMVLLHMATENVIQSEILNFSQVPYVYAQDISKFTGLVNRAQNETIRLAMFGDSQETSIGGAGSIYVPRLNYEGWKVFGNVPETFVASYGSYGASGTPYGDWLITGSRAAPGASITRLQNDQILPGIVVGAHTLNVGNNNINGEWYGQLVQFRQNAVGIHPDASIPTDINYMCTDIHAQVFAATNISSGNIQYYTKPYNSTGIGNFFASITNTVVVPMSLTSPVFAIKSAFTPTLGFNGQTYQQVELVGDSLNVLTDVVGIRFISNTCIKGLVIQSFAAGGYKAASIIEKHANAGEMFKAFNFHGALLHFGANDGSLGISANDHKIQVLALIVKIREWMGDNTFPIILVSDPYRDRLTDTQQKEFDKYPGVYYIIAQKDANIAVLNSRRLMEDIGWKRDGSSSIYLADGVHYTPVGAKVLAEAEMRKLTGQ